MFHFITFILTYSLIHINPTESNQKKFTEIHSDVFETWVFPLIFFLIFFWIPRHKTYLCRTDVMYTARIHDAFFWCNAKQNRIEKPGEIGIKCYSGRGSYHLPSVVEKLLQCTFQAETFPSDWIRRRRLCRTQGGVFIFLCRFISIRCGGWLIRILCVPLYTIKSIIAREINMYERDFCVNKIYSN